MKKIGREVLFLKTGENNPRNGEGAFVRLDDKTIMYAYTRYIGDEGDDHHPADIYAVYSYDEGETWHDEKIIVKHYAANVMSVSFVKFNNNDIGLIYIIKDETDYSCKPHIVRTSDNGKTWSEPVCCVDRSGYFIVINDGAVKLSSGRVIIPATFHKNKDDKPWSIEGRGVMYLVASDDDGKTWYTLSFGAENPVKASGTGLQEIGLYEHEDGEIFCYARTDLSHQFGSHSQDGGKTWSTFEAMKFFTSPQSPMRIKKVCNDLTVAIFNPIPIYNTRKITEATTYERSWGRTPFVCAVSKNDGRNFDDMYYIEDDLENGYCYPSIFDGGDYFLVAYYHSNNSHTVLNSCKIVKIDKSEIEVVSSSV